MKRRRLKLEILRILDLANLREIRENLTRFPPSEVVNPLFSALCSPSEQVRWHAITAFGWLVPAMADNDLESARIIMRRFLWSLNDESGGIGWGAPEAMAEIMAQDDRLVREYLHLLLSYAREDGPEIFQDGNFLELPMLQRGLLWGLGRLCFVRRDLLHQAGIGSDVRNYLNSPDGVVRGLAVWVLTALADTSAAEDVARLQGDSAELQIYWQGSQTVHTVSALAREYLRLGREQNPE